MSIYLTEVAPGKRVIDYKTYLVRLPRLKAPYPLIIEYLPNEEESLSPKSILRIRQRR